MSDQVVARLAASPPRRYVAVFMLAALGALIVYLAFSMAFGATQIMLLLFGLFMLWAVTKLMAATTQILVLTQSALKIEGGAVLARVEDMDKVERGAFAFKPSNGFLLTVKTPGPRRWAPGLFWTMGRRIGVGGVTGAPQSKAMAEALSGLIAMQDAPSEN